MAIYSLRADRRSLTGRFSGCVLLALAMLEGGLLGEVPVSEPRVVIGGLPTPAARSSAQEGPRAAAPRREMNSLILAAVQAMPTGGTYRTNAAALLGLRRSIQAANSQLLIDASQAAPSFCSGATYLIFLSVLGQLNRDGQLPLDENVLAALLVQEHQADGAGVWGRWNANGPGTARLFHEADLGRNFTSFEEARAGDFMKIFWNDEIGSREAGHSVIFLATVTRPDGEYVQFWSSNQPNGFGVKTVPRQKIKRQLFSRFEHPENIARMASLPAKDAYLAAMLKRPSDAREMARMVGAPDAMNPLTDRAVANPASGSPSATPAPTGETAPKKGFFNRLFKR